MRKKNEWIVLLFVFTAVMVQGCGRNSTVCATEPPNLPVETRQGLAFTSDLEASPSPVEIQIRGRGVLVDRIVHGYLCDDVWSGTVYVDCDVEVPVYEVVSEEEADFFEGCDLEIAAGTVVYVAYHNDEAYYKGCSCHTGE